MTERDMKGAIAAAARLIQDADGLLIGAGAGMGIDSGLPDFRGPQGFWRHYPALGRAGLSFERIACPQAFESDPEMAWGFYGHRLSLYRDTVPHRGFRLLADVSTRLPQGAFVFTSNVDGQFQKAGFDPDRIVECHGSIHHLQCLGPCSDAIWRNDTDPDVDEAECKMTSPLPRCPACKGLARPNILMFGDWGWVEHRSRAQSKRFSAWRATVGRLAIIEFGAGTHVPSVRHFCEDQAKSGALVRVNPREPQRPANVRGVSLPMAAAEAMDQLYDALIELGVLDGS